MCYNYTTTSYDEWSVLQSFTTSDIWSVAANKNHNMVEDHLSSYGPQCYSVIFEYRDNSRLALMESVSFLVLLNLREE